MRTHVSREDFASIPRRLRWSTLLCLSLGSCSSPRQVQPPRGTVLLEATLPEGVQTSGGSYELIDHAGELVRFGTLPTPFAPLPIVVEEGPDYVVSINALGYRKRGPVDLECEGFRKFDVFGGEQVRIPVKLACHELWPGAVENDASSPTEVCGVDALVVAPLQQQVGASIHVSADVISDDASFTWTSSSSAVGHFDEVTQDDPTTTRFKCDAVGRASIGLKMTGPGCEDSATVQIECLPNDEHDAGER